MKRYSLLLVPLVAVVFAVSCRDSTSPASHALLAPRNPDLGVLGNKPPPPADAVIAVTISSFPRTAIFTGVYFSNGIIDENGTEFTPTLDGMAWLRFDNNNKQPGAVGGFFRGFASANARFMVKGDDTACPLDPSTCPTGMGTLTIGGEDFKIVSVENFTRYPTCGEPVEGDLTPCARIGFTVVAVGCVPTPLESCIHHGNLIAFDKSTCLPEGESGPYYNPDCPLPSSGID